MPAAVRPRMASRLKSRHTVWCCSAAAYNRFMALRSWFAFLALALPLLSSDWDARKAAAYLDSRAKEWVEWPHANDGGAPCISCHTSAPYLIARPALRAVLHESAPTPSEAALLGGVRAKVGARNGMELFPSKKAGLLTDQIFGANS